MVDSKRLGLPDQPAPDFEGSTFAAPAPLVPVSVGLPPGYLTAPDIDGACLFDFVVAKIKELGNPADAVQLFIWDKTAVVFPDAPADKILQDCHPANHPFGAIAWQTYRLDVKLPNGNYDQSGKRILPNTLAILAGTTLAQFKAYVASWTPENYSKTPYVLATVQAPFT